MSLQQPEQPSSRLPRADEISSNLVTGEDPLDFIKQNLRQQTPQPQPVTSVEPTATQQLQEAIKTSFTDKEIGLELPYATSQTPTPPAPTQGQTQPVENQDEQPTEASTQTQTPEAKGPEESLKHLRKKTGELSRTVEERVAEVTKLQEELEKYKTGEAIPETVSELKQRISELEHYEQLHNLRMSPDYTERYVEPIEELKEKAVGVANEYGVDPAVLDQAYKLENKRDLNQFLRRHFDDVGALEVRDILTNIKTIAKEAQEAEAAPAQTLAQLKEEQQRNMQREETTRVERISSTAKSGWVDALTELRSAGNYPELTLTGDSEHDKFVQPILSEAAAEYGKLIKELGLNGTKELRPEAAKILAKRYLLSQAAAIAMESRAQHYQRAEEIASTAKRQSNFIRPPVGGGTASSGVNNQSSKPRNLQEAADMLLQQVGVK